MTELRQRMGGELRAGQIDSGQGSVVYVKTDNDILASGSHKDLSLERARILSAGGNLIGDVDARLPSLKAAILAVRDLLNAGGENPRDCAPAAELLDTLDLIERRIREAKGE